MSAKAVCVIVKLFVVIKYYIHSHDEAEVLCNLRGSGEYGINEEEDMNIIDRRLPGCLTGYSTVAGSPPFGALSCCIVVMVTLFVVIKS